MNAKGLYLAWVRTHYPKVYSAALAKTFNPRGAGLGGLGDDLTDSVLQPITVSSSILVPDTSVDSSTAAAINAANADPGTSWGSFFNSLTNAISGIGQTVVNTQAQQNLLSVNTQRARVGLPPLNANGVPITAMQIAGTQSPSLQQMEANLAQAGMWPWLIGGGLALALLLGKRSRG